MKKKRAAKMPAKDRYVKRIETVEATARKWGYRSRREIACFVYGWVKGFNDAVADDGEMVVTKSRR